MQERIGPYCVLGRLGVGGMGVVERVAHTETGQEYALKRLSPLGASDPVERQRFVREAQALASLAHPHVVGIHSAQLEGPSPYFVQPLLRGGSLAERLRRGPLPVADAQRIARQLAAGLAHAHAAGVLHRDLKPENVLFDEEGRAQLADFGLARGAAAESLTATGTVMGTPAYMAPEQAQDASRVDERADVYSLGAVLYAMLAGRPPLVPKGSLLMFLGRLQTEAPQPLRELRPDVPAGLAGCCERALAKDPAGRWESAADFERALAEPSAGRSGPPRIGLALALLLAVASLLVVAGLGLATLQGRAGPPTPSPGPSLSGSTGPSRLQATPTPSLVARLGPLRLERLLDRELPWSRPRADFYGDGVLLWVGDRLELRSPKGARELRRVKGEHGGGSFLRAKGEGAFVGTRLGVFFLSWRAMDATTKTLADPPKGYYNASVSSSHVFTAGQEGVSVHRLAGFEREETDPAPGTATGVLPLPDGGSFLACGTTTSGPGWIARWRRTDGRWKRSPKMPTPSHIRSLARGPDWVYAGDGLGRIHRFAYDGSLSYDSEPFLSMMGDGLGEVGVPVRGLVILQDVLLAVACASVSVEGSEVDWKLKAWRLPSRELVWERELPGAAPDGCLTAHPDGRSALLYSDRQVYMISERRR